MSTINLSCVLMQTILSNRSYGKSHILKYAESSIKPLSS